MFTHFKNLLGNNNSEEEIDDFEPEIVIKHTEIFTNAFTKDEYLMVKNNLVDGKTVGPDGVAPEAFKYCKFDDILLEYANKILLEKQKPMQWSTCQIMPIPKSGNLNKVDNYRVIAISVIALKITNKMILNRIQPIIDPLLRHNQNGFRPRRSTTTYILALRRLIEGIKEKNLKAIITFVDFKKAFDTLNRNNMFKILLAYGIPTIIVEAIETLYKGTKAKVLTPDGENKSFNITTGVLQGDTLAPFLFIIVLDYAMRMAVKGKQLDLGFELTRKQSRRVPAKVITDLSYADDIALISQDIEQAQELLSNVETQALKLGLKINSRKTEIMAFSQSEPINIHSLLNEDIKVVNNFKYLGAWMSSSSKDFEIRKALAWQACHKLKKLWNSKLKRKLKIRTFQATIESILLYGSETWTIDKSLERRINGCYTRLLRMILNVSWRDHITNVELYKELPKITDVITTRRLRIAGHCIRHDDEVAHDLILWQPTSGKSNRGRKAVTYIDNLKKDTGLDDVNEIRNVMMIRDDWKKIVKKGRTGVRHK